MVTVRQSQTEDEHRFAALHALYDNKQQWVRHYEKLLAHITPISTTASLAIAAFIAENDDLENTAFFFLLVPLTLICFNIWFNRWCDLEMRRQFQQIVIAETGMGFYDYMVGNEPVLPACYKTSPVRTRPIVYAGYILQFVSLCVLVLVAGMHIL